MPLKHVATLSGTTALSMLLQGRIQPKKGCSHWQARKCELMGSVTTPVTLSDNTNFFQCVEETPYQREKEFLSEGGPITVQFLHLLTLDSLFFPPILFAKSVLMRTVGESYYFVHTHDEIILDIRTTETFSKH